MRMRNNFLRRKRVRIVRVGSKKRKRKKRV
jgi:hypothetical protein